MRVVIADDSVLLRAGVAQVLAAGGADIVAEVSDASALLDAIRRTSPDLAVVDVRMPPSYTNEGLRAAIKIKAQHPRVGVLILSQWVEEQAARDLLAATPAGVGYLLKERVSDIDAFTEAARHVTAGETVLDPEVVQQLVARRINPLQRLTERERHVLALMAEGRSNTAIAAALSLSDSAVAKHINSIFTKLDLPPSDTEHRRVTAVLHYLNNSTDE
jgi:DNA-binding NarL/FixJ family response regulator